MKDSHLKYLKKVMDMIEKEEIIFKDQYGVEHKVFSNKDTEFMYKESVYFKDYEEVTLHNPYFPL